MAFESAFVELPLDQLHREAAVMKAEGWRFIQTHAVASDDAVDLYYSFMRDGAIRNYKVAGVHKDQPVPSITDLFLAAFVFENEARELFGVDMRDIALDFQGAMYSLAVDEPMTIITPEQKAAREKAAKAAAKAAQAPASDEGGSGQKPAKRIFVMTPERRARLDAKLATMSPEKVAKVEAALKAREAEAAVFLSGASQGSDEAADTGAPGKGELPKAPDLREEKRPVDRELESKIAMMDPDKAARVRAALGQDAGKEAGESAQAAGPKDADASAAKLDAELESKLSLMDAGKEKRVRAAIAAHLAGRAAAEGKE